MTKGGEQLIMYTLYQAGSNTTTNGTALGAAGQDIRIYRLVIGAPVASGNIYLYNITNPVNGATTNIAAKITLPATLPTTGAVTSGNVIDFGPTGLPVTDGGNIIMDQTMQVSVIWNIAPTTGG